jgi:hypothetical protein
MLPADGLKKALAAVKKLRKQIDDVELFRSEKSLNIIAGPVSIKIRFIEGEYADIGKIHQPSGPGAQFRTDWFVTALKRMKPMTSTHDRGITLHFRERELELWSYLSDMGAGFTTIGGKVDPELVGTKMVFNVEYLLTAARKCNGSVKIVSNQHERSPWGFGPEDIMPFANDGNGYHDRIERPSMAPPIEDVAKSKPAVRVDRPVYRVRTALVIQDIPKAEPTEAWRTDPKADPGAGWKWEHESPYFPAHWARVA